MAHDDDARYHVYDFGPDDLNCDDDGCPRKHYHATIDYDPDTDQPVNVNDDGGGDHPTDRPRYHIYDYNDAPVDDPADGLYYEPAVDGTCYVIPVDEFHARYVKRPDVN